VDGGGIRSTLGDNLQSVPPAGSHLITGFYHDRVENMAGPWQGLVGHGRNSMHGIVNEF
jgi:hypothetical protein